VTEITVRANFIEACHLTLMQLGKHHRHLLRGRGSELHGPSWQEHAALGVVTYLFVLNLLVASHEVFFLLFQVVFLFFLIVLSAAVVVLPLLFFVNQLYLEARHGKWLEGS